MIYWNVNSLIRLILYFWGSRNRFLICWVFLYKLFCFNGFILLCVWCKRWYLSLYEVEERIISIIIRNKGCSVIYCVNYVVLEYFLNSFIKFILLFVYWDE